ncbi:MAG: hypothetical protein ACP5L4_03760 [Thermoplasmata archaeon]
MVLGHTGIVVCHHTYVNMCPAGSFTAPAWVRLPENEGLLLMPGQIII